MRSILLSTLLTFALVKGKEIELELEIPWPSGIYIDKVVHTNGDVYRFGRLRNSMVSIRPPWQSMHVIEDVFDLHELYALVRKANNYAKEHAWSKGRHIDYGLVRQKIFRSLPSSIPPNIKP